MKKIFAALLPLIVILLYPRQAHAIIILPFVALIPAAHIIGIALAGLGLPALGLGTLWSKMFGHSMKRIIGIVVGALIVIAVITFAVLKMIDPDRPLF